MKSNLYCIYDTVAKRTTEPFSCPNDDVAKRNSVFGCFSAQTVPNDIVLFCVGEFHVDEQNPECMSIKPCSRIVPISIGELDEYHKLFTAYYEQSEEVEA